MTEKIQTSGMAKSTLFFIHFSLGSKELNYKITLEKKTTAMIYRILFETVVVEL